jgi:hypothetical protein
MQVPGSTSAVQAQLILDRVLIEGDSIVPKKRSYDNDKFESLFPDGLAVYNRLLSSSRAAFMRFLNVPTQDIPRLIDAATGYEVDRSSQPYDTAYAKVLQWRKNWFSLYLDAAEVLIQELLAANGYLKALSTEKPYTDLKSAYARLYSWLYIGNLFHQIDVGTYVWKDTLEKPLMKALYKTMYTYTMV